MRKHWTAADFVETHRHTDEFGTSRYGYCRKCTGDMQSLYGDRLLHYQSHQHYRDRNRPRITGVA